MKFYLSQIDLLLTKISKGEIKAILLFGPNKGYITKICQLIIDRLNLLKIEIPDESLNSSKLEVILNSKNFFNQKEFIKISLRNNQINAEIKKILNSSFYNFLALIGDEIEASSALRKFFESEKNLASLSCYYDDPEVVANIILTECRKAGKSIDNESLTYLKSILSGDYDTIKNEIEKLLYFTQDKSQITITDVTSAISSCLTANGDILAIYFLTKQNDNFIQELNKLLNQNINEVLIIRALIRYYMNLFIVLSHIKNGETLDNACKLLAPPIFFKYLDAFKEIAKNITIGDIINALNILQEAEVNFKLTPYVFDFYQEIYLRIYENENAK